MLKLFNNVIQVKFASQGCMLRLHFKISQSVVLMGTTIQPSENLTNQQAFLMKCYIISNQAVLTFTTVL